jgi:hypothetical protein
MLLQTVPDLPLALKQMEFCICLVLTILGYIPGIIYAIYVLVALDRDEPQREYYAVA